MIPVYQVKRIRALQLSDVERCDYNALALRIARRELAKLDREHLICIYLNAQNVVVGIETLAIGGTSSCYVDRRAVFRGAILAGAGGVILAHNHPSGDVTPSNDDRELLKALDEAGELLGVPVVDFLIVTDGTETFSDIHSIKEGRSHA
jgi:DNA repair protein RadC